MVSAKPTVDYLAEDERDAIRLGREIVVHLNWRKLGETKMAAPEEPRYDPEELLGIGSIDVRKPLRGAGGDRPDRQRLALRGVYQTCPGSRPSLRRRGPHPATCLTGELTAWAPLA